MTHSHRFISNLTYLRNKAGLSQAKLCRILGISRSRYSSYEEYRAKPGIDMIVRFLNFYNVTFESLINEDLKARAS